MGGSRVPPSDELSSETTKESCLRISKFQEVGQITVFELPRCLSSSKAEQHSVSLRTRKALSIYKSCSWELQQAKPPFRAPTQF